MTIQHWVNLPFSEATIKVGSGATPTGGKESYHESGIPLIRSQNVRFEGFMEDGLVFLDAAQAASLDNAIVCCNDVLLNITGASIGRVTLAPSHLDGARVNQHVTIIRLKKGINPSFVRWFFASPGQQRKINSIQVGVTRQALTKEMILRFELPLPSLREQERIVAKIEELFSDLDAGVAALKRAKANLKRYRAAVLKAAVEGKLTEEWRSKHPAKEPASKILERILKERRQKWEADQIAKFATAKKEPPKNWREKYVEPSPPVKTGLPELPNDWCWASVDQICDVGTGTTPSRTNAGFYENGLIPWIMSGAANHPFVDEASEFVTELALQETTLRLYPKGTLILALYGEGKTRGMVSELRIEATVNQALGALVFSDSAIFVQPFLKVFLMSNYVQLRRQAAGGMQPNLNLGIVKQIVMPLPPISEQAPIVAEVASRISQIDVAETSIEHDLLRADRLRQSILKQAFEGKLVPQDLQDESASVLLERLKVEAASRRLPTDEQSKRQDAASTKRTRGKMEEANGSPRTRSCRMSKTPLEE